MDRQIRRLGIAIVALFALLFGQLAYVQVIAADRIANHPANFTRQLIAEYEVHRGSIVTRSGLVLAESVEDGDDELRFRRRYPQADLFGHVTGFYSSVYGRSGLEDSMNAYLSGEAPELAVSNLTDLILGRPKEGASIVVTIDPDLQQAARDALGRLPGAVAAIDPRTGDVLALWSNPSFDPNLLSSGSRDEIRRNWRRLTRDPDEPMRSRAFQELYLPGSSFKIITASAAVERGHGPDSVWPNPHRLDLPQTDNQLRNFADSLCNGGSPTVTLREAFVESCNVTFGEVGLKLGAGELAEQVHAFGYCPTLPPTRTECDETTIPFALSPWSVGRFPDPIYYADKEPNVAYAAVGLDNDLTNPLMQALVAGAIANRGNQMAPRLVLEVRDPQGRTIRTFDEEVWGHPITAQTADRVTSMMLDVVRRGTASSAFAGFPLDRFPVAGKTGTATQGEGVAPHAWFTAFGPAGAGQQPRIAVAVIVVNGGGDTEATGGAVAAPIAREVFEAFMKGTG
jgi:peptidoglycan glycosyltransferase